MGPISWILAAVGFVLQGLVFHQFARGWWRRFPFLFLFLVVLVLISVVQAASIFDDGGWTDATAHIYWYSAATCRTLMYLAILHLIWQVASCTAGTRLVLRLAVGSVALSLSSLYLHFGQPFNLLLTEVSRDVSFLGLILNMFLWTVLLRQKDRLLLALSSAIGIQMATEAAGHALRRLSATAVPYGNFLVVGGELLLLFLWWFALRRTPIPTAASARESGKQPAEAVTPS